MDVKNPAIINNITLKTVGGVGNDSSSSISSTAYVRSIVKIKRKNRLRMVLLLATLGSAFAFAAARLHATVACPIVARNQQVAIDSVIQPPVLSYTSIDYYTSDGEFDGYSMCFSDTE